MQDEKNITSVDGSITESEFETQQYKRLVELLIQAITSGGKVKIPADFSEAETDALHFAAGQEQQYVAPLKTFLNLEPNLQKFVLEAKGLGHHIGKRLGSRN